MYSCFIFPGQGTQKVGMAASFVHGFKSGIEVMEEIEDAISFKLSKLIDEGPIEELTKTENAQPAIFAVSLICATILEKEYGYNITKNCKYLAGHSLGEYSALCVAGVLSISDTAKLVRIRGELMAKSFDNDAAYSMVAIIGVAAPEIEDLVKPYQSGRNVCVIANDNSLSQVVISGDRQTVKLVAEKAKDRGATNFIELNTSGPFHSPLMAQAAIKLDAFLAENIKFSDFKIPVIMNVTAKPLNNKQLVHNYLIRQMTGRIRWRETIDFIKEDPEIQNIIEIAPGKVLSSMIKRSDPNANVMNLETVAQIEEFIKTES
ncbi:MAG: ACP S-malonyltransferase [Holosporales bacterium]|jgi:[acyl-carrier-protein] S-malonyltransferase|nr:ACP S-malonyltransferase [Holosporales bacterium]